MSIPFGLGLDKRTRIQETRLNASKPRNTPKSSVRLYKIETGVQNQNDLYEKVKMDEEELVAAMWPFTL